MVILITGFPCRDIQRLPLTLAALLNGLPRSYDAFNSFLNGIQLTNAIVPVEARTLCAAVYSICPVPF